MRANLKPVEMLVKAKSNVAVYYSRVSCLYDGVTLYEWLWGGFVMHRTGAASAVTEARIQAFPVTSGVANSKMYLPGCSIAQSCDFLWDAGSEPSYKFVHQLFDQGTALCFVSWQDDRGI